MGLELFQRAIGHGGHPDDSVMGPETQLYSLGLDRKTFLFAPAHDRHEPWI
jgi:hypothetical protein